MLTAIDLLRDLTATPDLQGAACVDQLDVFDACLERGAAARAAYPRAIRVCAGCPALRACSDWVESLPMRRRPIGVTAGRVRQCRT